MGVEGASHLTDGARGGRIGTVAEQGHAVVGGVGHRRIGGDGRQRDELDVEEARDQIGEAKDDLVLLSYSDRAALEKLDLWREQRANEPPRL